VIAVTEIYYEGTGEEPIPGVTGRHLAESIEAYEGRPVVYLADRDALEDFLRSVMTPGELLRSGARPGPSEDGRW
jgi:hypothetical protein